MSGLSTSKSSGGNKRSRSLASPEGSKCEGPWRLREFPGKDQRLDNHLYAQPSRLVQERWLTPESVVGTRAWARSNGGFRRNFLEAGRGDWLEEQSSGACRGSPSSSAPSVFGGKPGDGPSPKGSPTWHALGARWQPPEGSLASHTALRSTCAGMDGHISGSPHGSIKRSGRSASASALTAGAAGQALTAGASQRSGPSSPSQNDSQDMLSRDDLGSPSVASTAKGQGSPLASAQGSRFGRSAGTSQSRSENLTQSVTDMKLNYPPTPAYVRTMLRHLPM